MNLQGTPGRTKIVPVDPNNQRVDFDTQPGLAAGTYNQVTVDAYGRVISGTFIPPVVTPTTPSSTVTASAGIEGRLANYAGAAPTWTPPNNVIGVAIDLSNNRIWWYFNGSWN
jgi:hypothetical protein